MDFKIKGTYSFNVYPVALYGTSFKNVVVMGTIDQETANLMGFDTVAEHAAVYATLPTGTPNDPSAYLYVKVRLLSGATKILGLPWIVESSIQEIELGTFTVKVANQSANDQTAILNALAANGFNVVDISFQ